MNFLSHKIDDLVSMMLNDAMIASKVSVFRNKQTLSIECRNHCKLAYKKYRKLKPDHRITKCIPQERGGQNSRSSIDIEKWNKKYPLSLRFRTLKETYDLISTNKQCFKNAQQYMSINSHSSQNCSIDIVKRCRVAMIVWYCLNKPNYKKLPSYIQQFI